ncbi:MAG: hypothetical protein ACLP5H_26460 [Desulfomonilaceae bacterium]
MLSHRFLFRAVVGISKAFELALFPVVFVGVLRLATPVALIPGLKTQRGRTEHVNKGKGKKGSQEDSSESLPGTNTVSVSLKMCSNYWHGLNLLEKQEV